MEQKSMDGTLTKPLFDKLLNEQKTKYTMKGIKGELQVIVMLRIGLAL